VGEHRGKRTCAIAAHFGDRHAIMLGVRLGETSQIAELGTAERLHSRPRGERHLGDGGVFSAPSGSSTVRLTPSAGEEIGLPCQRPCLLDRPSQRSRHRIEPGSGRIARRPRGISDYSSQYVREGAQTIGRVRLVRDG